MNDDVEPAMFLGLRGFSVCRFSCIYLLKNYFFPDDKRDIKFIICTNYEIIDPITISLASAFIYI